MIQKSIQVVVLVLVLGFGFACATGGGADRGAASLPHTAEMDDSFRIAERVFYARKFDAAEAEYQAYLKQFPYNVYTAKAYFRLGEIYLHREDYAQALTYYRKSLQKGVARDWGGLAQYKSAVCYAKVGDTRRVFESLNDMDLNVTDAGVRVRAASLRVNTAEKSGSVLEEKKGYIELVDAYEDLRPSQANVGDLSWVVRPAKARSEVSTWINSEDEAPLHVLESWMKRFEKRPAGALVSWKIAKTAYKKGDYSRAVSWSRDYLQHYPKQEYASEARAMLAELDKRGEGPVSSDKPVVGVVLPLSGKYAVYGESVLHGLECAAGVYEPCRDNLNVKLLVRDTAGDPQKARQAVEELSRNLDVRAVIGPLLQVEVDQATAAAEAAGLPLLVLSQKGDVAKSGEYIFRNFLTVADQVATLVDVACREKKWKKMAILYPEGETGEEYLKAFQKEVGDCGGEMVVEASYPPDTNDFTDVLRGFKLSKTSEKNAETLSFEALFIPDVYRKVSLVADALKFLKIDGIHLLGGAGWNNPGLLKSKSELLEGSLFVDGFYVKSESFKTRDFVSTFQAAYGVEPTLLEAYGYDTLGLVGNVLRNHPTSDRAEIQKALAVEDHFLGVTGNISFDSEGDARRRLFVLTVRQGEIREVK